MSNRQSIGKNILSQAREEDFWQKNLACSTMPARLADASRSGGDSIRVIFFLGWPRSTMDSIRVSEAPDPGSIPGEATTKIFTLISIKLELQRLLFLPVYKAACWVSCHLLN